MLNFRFLNVPSRWVALAAAMFLSGAVQPREAAAVTVPLQQATATGEQGGFEISRAINGNFGDGWAPNLVAQTAAFETVSDTGGPEGSLLTFTMASTSCCNQHSVGKFRISATTANRSAFADGVGTGGNVGAAAIWTPLNVLAVTADGQATFTKDSSQTVLVGLAAPNFTTYTVKAQTGLSNITGLRLEVFEDPSLPTGGPTGGPGRNPANGNFVLSEFQVDRTSIPAIVPVGLQNATADNSQAGFSVTSTIDNVANTGWASSLGDGTGSPLTAAYETMFDVGAGFGETILSFKVEHNNNNAQHTLGRFRFSATTDNRSLFADGLDVGGDITANWTILDQLVAASAISGAVITPLGDGSFLVSGVNPATDTYDISLRTALQGITGIRLETLEHVSLGANGPGRAFNGNFVLTNLSLTAQQIVVPEPTTAVLALFGVAGLAARRRRVS